MPRRKRRRGSGYIYYPIIQLNKKSRKVDQSLTPQDIIIYQSYMIMILQYSEFLRLIYKKMKIGKSLYIIHELFKINFKQLDFIKAFDFLFNQNLKKIFVWI